VWKPDRCFTWVSPGWKGYYRDKHTSLLRNIVTYGQKMIYNIEPPRLPLSSSSAPSQAGSQSTGTSTLRHCTRSPSTSKLPTKTSTTTTAAKWNVVLKPTATFGNDKLTFERASRHLAEQHFPTASWPVGTIF
jgi:hypothetical protein